MARRAGRSGLSGAVDGHHPRDPRREARHHRVAPDRHFATRRLGRSARREFPMISDELAYRFRDVYDNLVRIADEALIFQDRVTSISRRISRTCRTA